ncbi:DUF3021 family protein [Streptococcus ferus]|uniref:DUF3021 family protein n=1 Tax=Streptococcus ferus TaxID=1345 RepID=UPI0035A11FBE
MTYFVYQNQGIKAFRSLIAVTLIATAVSAATVIYDYDVCPIKKKIFVHCLVMLVTVYPSLIISVWYDTTKVSGYIFAFLTFALWGLVLGTVGYLISKYILKNIPEDKSKK